MIKRNLKDDNKEFETAHMQKEAILKKLHERKFRITKQRRLILNIMLEDKCSCCKEIYYKAVQEDHNIGIATVYRMINTLEEIGVIRRKDMYQFVCSENENQIYEIHFEDETVIQLSHAKLKQVISKGFESYGYMEHKGLRSIAMILYNE